MRFPIDSAAKIQWFVAVVAVRIVSNQFFHPLGIDVFIAVYRSMISIITKFGLGHNHVCPISLVVLLVAVLASTTEFIFRRLVYIELVIFFGLPAARARLHHSRLE